MNTTVVQVPLGSVCKLKNGFAFKSSTYQSTGTPVVRISDINDRLVSTEDSVKVSPNDDFENYCVENGDILIAMSGATTGKFGIYNSSVKAYQNQRVGNFKIDDEAILSKKFLLYQLHNLKRKIEKDAYGGAQPNISSKKIEEMGIVLFPLAQQQAIVSKIEELFSKLDKGVESLKTLQQQLIVYRQSVLKWAFEGHFTGGKDQWKVATLGEMSESCLGKMLDKDKNKGAYHVYLGNINVRWGTFDLDNLKQMRFENTEFERYSLKKGDLVICEGGEPGRSAIWKLEGQNMKIQKALHRVRFSNEVSSEFFLHFLFLIASTKELEKHFTGTTIKHLTGGALKKIQFPFPPKKIQDRIVQEIESRLSVCDKIEETITNGLKEAEALRQSILKQAFEGKLV